MDKISIVTPVLNRRAFVAEAIESVLREQGGGFELEHVVVDGGSTDGTLDVLARYPHLTVMTGRDCGVYDALNKGIAAATGTVVGLLNSDDVLLPGSLEQVARAFAAKPSPEMVCLSARLAVADGAGGWRTTHVFPAAEHANPSRFDLLAGPILTNSRFYRPDVLSRFGPFDLGYRLIADRKLLVDLRDAGLRFLPIDHMALEYRSHPGSLTFTESPAALLRGIPEKLALAESYLACADLTADARRDFTAWHRHEVLMGLILAARTRSPGSAAQLAMRGFRGSLAWPVRVLPEAGLLARRRLARGRTGK